jgi:signal transduction histidine kinase
MYLPFSSKAVSFQPIPFSLLLYMEWIMISSCASLAIVEAFQKQSLPSQHLLILLALGLMGGMMPKVKLINKIVYTAIEIGLIFYGTWIGYLHILPTLYIIAVTRSCFLFGKVGRTIVASLCFFLFFLSQFQFFQSTVAKIPLKEQHTLLMHQVAEILVFGLGIFVLLQLVNTLLRERQKQDKLTLANQQLQEYNIQIKQMAAIQERNRIAREIHDSLGHALTALNVQLQTAQRLWDSDPSQAEEFLRESQKLSKTAIEEVRRSVNSLRVDGKNKTTFRKSIVTLIRDFSKSTGLVIFSNIAIETSNLPESVRETIYRVLQEGLTNAYKHAQANIVLVYLQATSTLVKLEIKDNGKGFITDLNQPGFGLQSMRERVLALKGSFSIETQPNAGCKINVQLSL